MVIRLNVVLTTSHEDRVQFNLMSNLKKLHQLIGGLLALALALRVSLRSLILAHISCCPISLALI